MEEEIVAQLGLILGQLRFTRRAVEDIERSTARYGNFAFAQALSQGARFGEPPMVAGALKVYVVNINDLAPGSGFFGFLEGLLGGVGRFIGGLFGGLIGGTIGGVTIPFLIVQIDRVAATIDRILDRLGIGRERPTPTGGAAARPQAGPQGAGLDLQSTLRELRQTLDTFTALFQAASGDTEGAARTSNLPQTEAGRNWLAMLMAASTVLVGIRHVVDGLILLVPILIGALALVITRLDDIKLAFVEMLQFILRNALLLRGVVLATILDTVAAAARLAANILGILASAVTRILTSVFGILGALLDAALASLSFLSRGLAATIDALLRWAADTVFALLTTFGDTLVFRVIVHIIQILPATLPPLYRIVTGNDLATVDPTAAARLNTAAGLTISRPTRVGPPSSVIPPFPDVAATLTPAADVARLRGILSTAATTVTTELPAIFSTAQGAVADFGRALSDTVARQEAAFGTRLTERLGTVRQRSTELAQAIAPAISAARQQPATGLEAIARAYEQWLEGGGLRALLGNITEHFRRSPTAGPGAAGTVPSRIVEGAAADRPRATVEIENVVIEITPPAQPVAPPPGGPTSSLDAEEQSPEQVFARVMELMHELQERGLQLGPGAIFPQLSTV